MPCVGFLATAATQVLVFFKRTPIFSKQRIPIFFTNIAKVLMTTNMTIEDAIDALDEALLATEGGQQNPLTVEQTVTPDAAPAPSEEEAPAPITAEAVAGDKAESPAAPDSSLLRDRLAALAAPKRAAGPDPREEELQQLRQAVQMLSANKVADPVAFLKAQTGMTPEQLIAKTREPDSLAQRAVEEARAAREEAQRLRDEIAATEQERQLADIRSGISSFVSSKADEYVVTNKSKNQDLVAQLMFSSIEEGNPLSEAQAAAQVESKLQDFINTHAPLLGWAKSDVSSKAVGKSEAQPSVTINPQTAASTPSKSWDDMSFEEREREALKLLNV